MTDDSPIEGGARPRAGLTRRALVRRAGTASLGLALLHGVARRGPRSAVAAAAPGVLADVALPPDLGQAGIEVYIEATSHTLRGLFLDYWRANGGAAVYGNPISEPFAAVDGYYSQAFERGVFQYRPEFLYTADPMVRLMPVGRLALLARLGFLPSRREANGDDARPPDWHPLDPASAAVARVLAANGTFVAATGHTISGNILAWYAFNEGSFYLGSPLTEPLTDGGTTIQYFEGGALEAGKSGVALASIVTEFASGLRIDTNPIARGDLPLYDESLFWTADDPNPLGAPAASSPKWVEVSLSEQRMWAYEGDTAVSTSLVSTGVDPNPTATGMFHIRLKYPTQDMTGFTNATGEVLDFGEATTGAISYDVKDVPDVMYFNMEGEALHGTYWHNNFGEKMSHGCVNLPLDVAAWLYGWAPLGTGVWVHA